ncbi:DUF2508 family protein [Pelosinus sp. UFO1]|jgi:hypothetical protein|uniref:DUF2508 family protein n=1 Tax=Pelosinus sp. UFO1 TaxID=484770 RepID=UPI0004D17252|nr:DUF2508 family protein [Pelosinus sp. UFO1]AIF54323.1 Protein of unknown function DUF2508 [Pelosinus sp. UFO1]
MNFVEALQKVQDYLYRGDTIEAKTLPALSLVVEEARQEWLNAQYYYNTVSDQDLVDHAVYLMQAAEKKYIYLLKKARQEGVRSSPYEISDTNIYKRQ